jgi:Flp pilus assembly protein CpaB
MRPVRIIAAMLFAATVGTLTLVAAPAWAAHTTLPVAVKASPSPVTAGHTVTVSGSVGPDAARSEC